jgi:hypothetical protein
MEDHNKWTGWLAGLMDSIVDYEGPAALSRAAFCFSEEGGCCYLGDQDVGARFESFHHCVVECHIAECPETAQIISDMIRQHCKSSKQLDTRLLIDQLARAVSRKMRLKMGIEIEDVFGNKKPIPAPDNERYELIRQLILRRVGADSIGGPIDELPTDLLLSTADSAVLLIVEQFYILREQGMTDELAIKTLNEAQATTLYLVGQNLPLIDHPATLFEYVRHFIDSQFAHGEPISDASLRDAIEMVTNHYNR